MAQPEYYRILHNATTPFPWEQRQRELKTEQPAYIAQQMQNLSRVSYALTFERDPSEKRLTLEITNQFNERLGRYLPDDQPLEGLLLPTLGEVPESEELRALPPNLRQKYNRTLRQASRKFWRRSEEGQSIPVTIGFLREMARGLLSGEEIIKGFGEMGTYFLTHAFTKPPEDQLTEEK
jgi:hypothetical protein